MGLFGLDDQWTTVDGNRVYARVAVDASVSKPAVILLHGVGLSSRYMVPLARHLKESFQVYAPDLPGFGWSSKRRRPPTVREQADDVGKWMDAMGIERASLFGNSLGSQVAVDLAYRFPQRIDKLVLSGPTPDANTRNLPSLYARQLMNMPREPVPMQLIYMLDYMQTGVLRTFTTMHRTCDDPIENKLPVVQAETLVIRGRRDKVVRQRWAEQVASLLPRGQLAVVERAAHCAHFSQAAYVGRLVSNFLLHQPAQPQTQRFTVEMR
jgi:pimeloyl-ACP methyl ester carboxylesterase